jgi:hypothetical protein
VLAQVDQGVLEEATLRRWLDGALIRADDRRLFWGRLAAGVIAAIGGSREAQGARAQPPYKPNRRRRLASTSGSGGTGILVQSRSN